MAREVVDDRLIGALHVRALTRAGLHHDARTAHTVVQTGTVAALLDGRYGGNVTLGELLEHGDLGVGTLEHLDGELIAVLSRFVPGPPHTLAGPLSLGGLTAALDGIAPRQPGSATFRATARDVACSPPC